MKGRERSIDMQTLYPLERGARIVVSGLTLAAVFIEAMNEHSNVPAVLFVLIPLLALYPLISGITGRDHLYALLESRRRQKYLEQIALSAAVARAESEQQKKRAA